MNTLFTKSIYLSLFAFLISLTSTFAQQAPISLKLVNNDQTNQLDVVAVNFQNVLGFQFGIETDNADLQYTSISSNSPLEPNAVWGNQIGNNVLVSWTSSNIVPVSFDTGETIFSIDFSSSTNNSKFCSSNKEIDFEGVLNQNGEDFAVDIIFIDDCNLGNPCVLVCNNQVMVSIPQGGITFKETGMSDMFTEGVTCDEDDLRLSIYDTQDDLANQNPIQDPTFTTEDDDRELYYQIKNIIDDNACWGSLILEFKITASIVAPQDSEADCVEDIPVDGISDTGRPLYYVAVDNYPKGSFGMEDQLQELGRYNMIEGPMMDLNVYVKDDVSEINPCEGGILERHYYLVEEGGFQHAKATQKITLSGSSSFDENSIIWPADMNLECESGVDVTGEPQYDADYCTLLASAYEDVVLASDEGSKILRTWTVINWCDGSTFEHTQIIQKICDNAAGGEGEPIILSTAKNNMNGRLDFIVENFKNVLGFQFGIESDMDADLQDLILSDHLGPGSLQENQIGNNVIMVWVNQDLDPKNVNKGEVLFSLDYSQDISAISFCASDKEILFEGVVDVDGQYTGVEIVIEDDCSQNDLIFAPEKGSGNCGESIPVDGITDEGARMFYVNNNAAPLSSFGDEDDLEEIGYYKDFVGDANNFNVYVLDNTDDLGACGSGTLKRTYYLQDLNRTVLDSDVQLITVGSGSTDLLITWPEETVTVECGAGLDVTGEPIVEEHPCQLSAVNYMDEIFDAGTKIVRTWTVVDWCSAGVSTFVQIIKTDCDTNDDIAPIAVCISPLSVNIENEDVKIWAQDLDGGSSDNVGIVSYEIKREDDTDFAEYITVGIEDEGLLYATLRVTDAAGNFSECFTSIEVGVIDVNPCLLVCNSEVNISMEAGQTFIINNSLNLEMFLESDPSICEDAIYVISLFDANGTDISSMIFDESHDGFEGSYTVTDMNSGNSCWGAFSIKITGRALVWPGDTNNDGLVNNFDVLNIGIGFDATGEARENAATSWAGQEASDWDKKFMNGLNYKFADADGQGIIDYADVDVVNQNWGEEHNFAGDQSERIMTGADIPLFLEAGTYNTDQMIQIPIHLGSTALPADEVYGIAFDVLYDLNMVKPENISISMENSWLATDNENILSVQKNQPSAGAVHFAMVRNDQVNKNGIGEIATLNIFFKEISNEFLASNLSIGNIKLINNLGDEMPAVDISSMINVQNTPTSTNNLNPVSMSVFPNPSNGLVNIQTNEQITNVKVMSIDGSLAKEIKGNVTELDLQDLEQQMYILQIETERDIIMKKVTLLKH